MQRFAIITGLFTDERANTPMFIEGDKYESQPEFIKRVADETAGWIHERGKSRRVINIQIALED